MSLLFRIFLISLLYHVVAMSEWTGKWTDNTFGGSVYVCVSQLLYTTNAQGMFSNIGYMRGSITEDNMWTGQYWMAGIESRRGQFQLMLNSSKESFDGIFTDSTGYNFKMNGYRQSGPDVSPSDIDCFRTSDDLLIDTSVPFNFSGTVYAVNVDSGSTQSKDVLTYSDSSVRVSWQASWGRGFNYGSIFNGGQVACVNWYEAGEDEGIELLVAKNSTSFYSIWIGVSSVSDFNYTTYFVTHKGYGVELNSIISKSASLTAADSFSYLRLLTETDEGACYAAIVDTSGSDDDPGDDDNFPHTMSIVILSIMLSLSLALNCYMGWTMFRREMNNGDSKDLKTSLIA